MINYKATKLDNGITVITENMPYLSSFSLGFWFLVGSRDENEANNGICHFIEHMFFKGTETRSAKQIAEEVEASGGYLNAFTTKEHTCFYGRGLAQNLEKTFSVLADMLQNSLFEDSEIKKEANVIVDELYDIEDSPEELIFDKLESSIYKNNSLSLPIIGTEENIRSFTSEDILHFIAQNYSSGKFFIVASGKVNHDEVLKMTEKYIFKNFDGQCSREKAEKFNIEDKFHYKDLQQSHFIIASTTYGFQNPRRAAVNLLSHILGEGSSSRLFQKLREENGIAYQINSFVNSFLEVSTFGVYFSTNHSSALNALNLVHKEFDNLRTRSVGQKELNKAKEYIKGNLLMSMESVTNRMFRLAHSFMYLGGYKSVEESIAEIDNVTGEDILQIANEILDPRKLSTIILSSKNHLIHSAA